MNFPSFVEGMNRDWLRGVVSTKTCYSMSPFRPADRDSCVHGRKGVVDSLHLKGNSTDKTTGIILVAVTRGRTSGGHQNVDTGGQVIYGRR